jgi:hypothetical protein
MDAASQTSATSPSPAATWQAWRIDDNGNTFLMRQQLTHEEADRIVTEFTARGHKQTCWTEPVPGEIGKL